MQLIKEHVTRLICFSLKSFLTVFIYTAAFMNGCFHTSPFFCLSFESGDIITVHRDFYFRDKDTQ